MLGDKCCTLAGRRGCDLRGRWETGIWEGRAQKSDEHMLIHQDKVVYSRTIRMLPQDESWSAEEVLGVRPTPSNPTPPAPGAPRPPVEVIPSEAPAPPPAVEEPPAVVSPKDAGNASSSELAGRSKVQRDTLKLAVLG